jgi:predicted Zn-dependent protease
VGPAAAEASAALRAPGLKPDPTSAEAGIWDLSDKAEVHVKSSAELESDVELAAYVRQVICKVAPEYCTELRVYLLDRPVLNAAAAPNGYVEVNSGLLLRAQTEDELAYVLGHEVSHFARSHSLQQWRHAKATANTMLVLQIGVAAAAAGAAYSAGAAGSTNMSSVSQAAQSLSDLIYLAGIANLFAFSREQENEADRLGFERAAAAGYSRGAGPSMWGEVIAEAKSSDFPKVRDSEARASMFATHPLTADRIAALRTLAGAAGDAGPDLAARRAYRAHIRGHLDGWLRDDLRRRDFGQTLHLIDRLEGEGEDLGILEFYRGEALRQRRGDGDARAALAAYRASIGHPDAPPSAWREFAEAARKAGDNASARDAYARYIALAPDAQDRWLIEASLKNLQPPGTP